MALHDLIVSDVNCYDLYKLPLASPLPLVYKLSSLVVFGRQSRHLSGPGGGGCWAGEGTPGAKAGQGPQRDHHPPFALTTSPARTQTRRLRTVPAYTRSLP